MKIAVLFVITSCTTITCYSRKTPALTPVDAAQLQRLLGLKQFVQNKDISRKSNNQFINQELQIPIDFEKLIHILNGTELWTRHIDSVKLNSEKIDALNDYADKLMEDERIKSYIQERVKRNKYGEEYGTGKDGSSDSASFASGLIGQVVGSIVGLSSGGSKGSSKLHESKPPSTYGTSVYQSYGKDSFNVWDFKRAILNTLIQAVKAISGGVLALKGHLIKGSGLLVSTKGRIISSAGEAISGLGKSLTSSTIVQPPQYAAYGQGAYGYQAPQIVAPDDYYDEPPTNVNGYHSSYSAPSNTIYAYAYYPPYIHYHYQNSKSMG